MGYVTPVPQATVLEYHALVAVTLLEYHKLVAATVLEYHRLIYWNTTS